MRRIGRIFKRAGETISNGNKGLKAAVLAASAVFLIALPAAAQDLTDNARYAAIVVDAQSGEVFYAQRADSARYPASLTKIMTLYMAFDALAHGTLKPTDQITMSAHATSQAPVKVYLRPGDTIDVDTAMRLIALYSANDLAVALAEKIGGGSEERFAAMMTIKAQELGMTHTRFVNANGLPDPRQISSARDLAILARAVMRDYPQYYDYFNLPSQEFRGRTYVNHNPLRSMPGIDGMKTGFTNAAGYNLVASGVRNNHRLIAVMLGGSNKTQRREHVTALMNTGFDVIARRDRGERIEIAQNEFTRAMDAEARMPEGPQPYTILADNGDVVGGNAPLSDAQLRETLEGSEQANAADVDVQRASATIKAPAVAQTLSAATNTAALVKKPATKVAVADKPTAQTTAKSKKAALADKTAKGKKKKDPTAVYAIQIGAFKDKSLANDWAKKMKTKFSSHLASGTTDISKNDNGWYRTRFVTLTKAQASAACKDISAKHLDCMVIKPDA